MQMQPAVRNQAEMLNAVADQGKKLNVLEQHSIFGFSGAQLLSRFFECSTPVTINSLIAMHLNSSNIRQISANASVFGILVPFDDQFNDQPRLHSHKHG